jgi:hypothetical protein
MHVERTYAITPAQLRDTLVDPDYLAALGARFAGIGEAEVETGDASITVISRRKIPVEYVPAAARGFVGDGVVTQTDLWSLNGDDPVDGSWTATLNSAPATMGGGYTIANTADGCHLTVTAEVKVKIPLIGGKIEAEIRRYLGSLVSRQMEFTEEWLGES